MDRGGGHPQELSSFCSPRLLNTGELPFSTLKTRRSQAVPPASFALFEMEARMWTSTYVASFSVTSRSRLANSHRSDESEQATSFAEPRRGTSLTSHTLPPECPDRRCCVPCSDPVQQFPAAREPDPDSDSSAPTLLCNTLSRSRLPAITSQVGKACDMPGLNSAAMDERNPTPDHRLTADEPTTPYSWHYNVGSKPLSRPVRVTSTSPGPGYMTSDAPIDKSTVLICYFCPN